MGKYLRISSYIRKPFLIYAFATAPLWISLYIYEENLIFFFISVLKDEQFNALVIPSQRTYLSRSQVTHLNSFWTQI